MNGEDDNEAGNAAVDEADDEEKMTEKQIAAQTATTKQIGYRDLKKPELKL